jgi:uncharacterized protein
VNRSAESETVLPAVSLVPGQASGELLVLTEPLNAWGGLDPETGRIVHPQHPQVGVLVRGHVLALAETRGSGTNAQVFAQSIVNGNGPSAVVLLRPDYVLCVGAIVAAELLPEGVPVPIVRLSDQDFTALTTGRRARVMSGPDGASVTVSPDSAGG